ncbi:hypothetical protein C2G38_2192100 [Gigaspora rosea]|uniref:Uncharacterized protein n=1 Tax=Gigaspora rosea TaxID=44941 RepID=A0A397V0P8_9GLOM|nr:hypothetical protein C2G38_2192100 [Gigaspora rosea]
MAKQDVGASHGRGKGRGHEPGVAKVGRHVKIIIEIPDQELETGEYDVRSTAAYGLRQDRYKMKLVLVNKKWRQQLRQEQPTLLRGKSIIAMSRKQKQTARHKLPEGSTASEETIGAPEASSYQAQDTESTAHVIDSQTKAYLDMMFQSTTVSVIQTVKQYMDQQFEVQKEWNVQCMETINRRFVQLEQANLGGNESSNNNTNNNEQMTEVQP